MEIETRRQRQRYTKGKIRAAERTLIATNICGIHGMGKTQSQEQFTPRIQTSGIGSSILIKRLVLKSVASFQQGVNQGLFRLQDHLSNSIFIPSSAKGGERQQKDKVSKSYIVQIFLPMVFLSTVCFDIYFKMYVSLEEMVNYSKIPVSTKFLI